MFGYWRIPFLKRPGFAFFALHKSGSSYAHTFLHRIFMRLKYRHETKLPSSGIENETYYGPVRLFESVPSGLFDAGKIILQVRDPRDILTSLYFSLRYSHALPADNPDAFLANRGDLEGVDINEFVLEKAEEIGDRFRKFKTFLDQQNVLLLRYEQMVTDFDRWFDQIIDFCGLTWNLKLRRCLNSIRGEADFTVDAEDVMQHKRQGWLLFQH